MKAIQLRFSRWYNLRAGRKGSFREGRYTSVIVQEGERALRIMAACIDLIPVHAGLVADPADYQWSGYSEAMAGRARSRRGLVRIVGQSAWPRDTAAGAEPWGTGAFPAPVERRALVIYRALLGGQGRERKREDGKIIRRGVTEKVRQRPTTPRECQLRGEFLTRRVRHFTRGEILGSRPFIDTWFSANRERFVTGRSRSERQHGASSLGRPALRGLYAVRQSGGSS